MNSFWFLDETPEETPELGGYSFGLIDEFNVAPEGSEILNNENQLERRIEQADDAFEDRLSLGESRKTVPGKQ